VSDSRAYPDRPLLAASAAVIRGGRVLLAARGREPMRGVFTLPGGLVEPGETLAEAARREVLEETGLSVEIAGLAGYQEVIARDDGGRIARHFVICAFAAHWRGGEPVPTEEAPAFRWADPLTLDDLTVTEGLHAIVAKALALVG